MPLGVNQHRLAVSIGVPPRRIDEIVLESVGSAPTLRCASGAFGTTDRFWTNLQTRFDLEVEKDKLGARLDEIQPLQSA